MNIYVDPILAWAILDARQDSIACPYPLPKSKTLIRSVLPIDYQLLQVPLPLN